jgi:hypothetical protein
MAAMLTYYLPCRHSNARLPLTFHRFNASGLAAILPELARGSITGCLGKINGLQLTIFSSYR